MTKDINTFSFRRMLMLTATELTEKRRNLLLQAGMVLLGLLAIACIQAFCNDYQYTHYTGEGDPNFGDMCGTYLVLLFIFGCLSASIMFSDLAGKEGRIRVLMRPGLAIEKFIARWIIYVVIFLAVYLAAVFIADSVRCLILKIRFPELHNIIPVYAGITPELIREMMPFHVKIFKTLITGVGIYLAAQSFFVLGSTIWPRMSFPKTFGMVNVLTFGYVAIIAGVVSMMPYGSYYYSGPTFLEAHFDIIFIGLLYGAILVNYVLAWRRLSETEVITTKR